LLKLLIHYDRPELFLDLIQARFPGLEPHCCRSYEALAADLAACGAEVVYCIKFEGRPYPREALLSQATLGWVSVGGAGVDHLAPWDPARLQVTNSAGVASDVMAQYVLGAVLALTFRLPGFMRAQAGRRWEPREVGSIAGRTLAVVGLGHTGRDVARRAGALGLRVVGVRARPRPMDGVARVHGPEALHEALAEADYVVVSLPLTGRTRHIIDRRALAAMKPGACLIDVSRGGVVDGGALAGALAEGRLGGAALDVFEQEPLPPDSPLWDLENVLLTPHCSSTYDGWERRSAELFCDNLERWRAGQPLVNVVDPARGY
jgi:phosphoglycerate dehydrogenase-like enzyme